MKIPLQIYGFTESATHELDSVFLPFDASDQARVKELFLKAGNDRVKIASVNNNIVESTSILSIVGPADLPHTKLIKKIWVTKKN